MCSDGLRVRALRRPAGHAAVPFNRRQVTLPLAFGPARTEHAHPRGGHPAPGADSIAILNQATLPRDRGRRAAQRGPHPALRGGRKRLQVPGPVKAGNPPYGQRNEVGNNPTEDAKHGLTPLCRPNQRAIAWVGSKVCETGNARPPGIPSSDSMPGTDCPCNSSQPSSAAERQSRTCPMSVAR